MSKLKNFVYLSICEVTIELFNNSFYTTYLGYCGGMRLGIDNAILSKRHAHDLAIVSMYLELIYGFDKKEIGEYIVSYFESDRFVEFQKLVILNESVFTSVDGVKSWLKINKLV